MYPNIICKQFFNLLDELVPFVSEIKVSKSELRVLPPCFKVAKFGFSHGCMKQWRGPFGLHIREYKSYFLIHRDISDPEVFGLDPFSHILFDVITPQDIKPHSQTIAKEHTRMQDWMIKRGQEQLSKEKRRNRKLNSSNIGRFILRLRLWGLLNSEKILMPIFILSILLSIAFSMYAFVQVGWEGYVVVPPQQYQVSFKEYLFSMATIAILLCFLIYKAKTLKCKFYSFDRICPIYFLSTEFLQ